MDFSTLGFPVLHHLPEYAQIHVHRVRHAIQASHTLLSPSPPTFNQLIVLCLVLLLLLDQHASFTEGSQVVWYHISLRIFYSSLWFTHQKFRYSMKQRQIPPPPPGISCLFYDPTDGDNLISGSSAFYKSILYIWKFSVHVLLKPSLKDFEHYFASLLKWVQL